MKLLSVTFVLLLVAQGWALAYEATPSPSPTPNPSPYGQHCGAGYGSGRYGGCIPVYSPPSPGATTSPPPPRSPPPPPPTPGAKITYSTASTVPAVTAVAKLDNYATVAAFNATERTRFVNVLEANILAKLNAVCNISITSVVASSISVTELFAFTGSDDTAAASAQSSLVSLLKSSDVSSVFGSSFGSVTVTSTATSNSSNPTSTKSGAATISLTFLVLTAMVVAVAGSMFML